MTGYPSVFNVDADMSPTALAAATITELDGGHDVRWHIFGADKATLRTVNRAVDKVLAKRGSRTDFDIPRRGLYTFTERPRLFQPDGAA